MSIMKYPLEVLDAASNFWLMAKTDAMCFGR
jgi:hypothetical protein